MTDSLENSKNVPDEETTVLKKLASEKRPISDDEYKMAMDYFNKSIMVFKNVIEIGKTSVDRLKKKETRLLWTKRLTVVSGVAEIIRGVLMFLPKEENPLIKEIEELTKKIGELCNRVSESFDDLKSVVSEINFFVKILSPTFVLGSYMRDFVKHPSPKAIKNFRRAYKKHPPIKLFYYLLSCLNRNSSNPLRMALDAEKVHTRETFDGWEDTFYLIMFKLLILESFANGLLEFKTLNNLNLLITRAEEVFQRLSGWEQEYMKNNDEAYWKDVKEYLEKHTVDNPKMTTSERAEHIKEKLETYLTNDAFYVLVFNVSIVDINFAYHCPKTDSRMIGIWNKGNCNVIVYRSHEANTLPNTDFVKVETDVKECNDGRLKQGLQTLKKLLQTGILDTNSVRNDGFVFLIEPNRQLEIRGANCPEHLNGPGWWEEVAVSGTRTPNKTLLVSFP